MIKVPVGQYFNKLLISPDQVTTIQLLHALAFAVLLPRQYLLHLAVIVASIV